jgi:hypothetical protein
VRVKVFVVVTIIQEKGEVCGRYTPTGIRLKQSSSRPALAYLRWYVDAVVSRPEIDLNAEHSRSHHDVVSTAIHVKWRAVGRATFVEEDTTSFVGVDGRVAVGANGSSVIGWLKIDSEYELIHKIGTYPDCGWRCGSGGIWQPGVVCKVA